MLNQPMRFHASVFVDVLRVVSLTNITCIGINGVGFVGCMMSRALLMFTSRTTMAISLILYCFTLDLHVGVCDLSLFLQCHI